MLQRILLTLLLVSQTVAAAPAAAPEAAGAEGSYPGRVLTEIARHRQAALQRLRAGIQPQAVPPLAAADVGHIAVLPDDGTLVAAANRFDLNLRSLTFQPAAGGYTVLAGTNNFDAAAASQGLLINPPPASNPNNIGDDGTREVAIGFAFPFFSGSYTRVFINSDGNLTFGAGDFASTARSLGRFLAGPPRIAPYFADLDPSVAGQLTVFSSPGRFVVTWSQVPDFSLSGPGPRETFQVALTPDGRIEFHYSAINGTEAVVGISPGGVFTAPPAVDLSAAGGSAVLPGPIAEVFTATTSLDVVAVSQRFYQTHEDAYQFLVIFTNFDFSLGGAFAYELNIANQVTGIGPVGLAPIFDFSAEFGSARLESLLNMGNLSRYPANPSTVFLRGVDSTLSILGQEAGHRFLAYARFRDPETGLNSTALLGRDLAHWSFFFNSDASVVEGNRIQDLGGGLFRTTGAVERYSELDQYLMGLRAPEEVSPTFLVKNPSLPISPGTAPSPGITFSGRRVDVAIEDIIAANGPRVPNSVTARKRHQFAFLLVSQRGTLPTSAEIAKLDLIRQEWESFYAQATSFRGIAGTTLVRALRILPETLGVLPGREQQVAVELAAPAGSDLSIQISNSNPAAAAVPTQVLIPAGSRSASLPVAALSPGLTLAAGRATITASAPGYESADLIVQVASLQSAAMNFTITAGNHQIAAPGSVLPQALEVALTDSNRIPYAGQRVEFTVIRGDASVNPQAGETNLLGKFSAVVQLGNTVGPILIRSTVVGTALTADFSLTALGIPQVPLDGVRNAASLALSPPSAPAAPTAAPGTLLSISGTNLSAGTAFATSLPLPSALAGTSVEIGGLPAPLLFISPERIIAQAPFELPTAVLNLRVQNAAAASTSIPLRVEAAFPGIFTRDASGSGAGAILHLSTQLPVTAQNPAKPGEWVQILATGLGRVTPAVASGQPAASPPSSTNLPVIAMIGGLPAPVSFSGLLPGYVGLYQVIAQVPSLPPGPAEVVVSADGTASQPVALPIGAP